MRGFAIGLFVLVFVAVSVLSLRPGGLKNQLRNVLRRFRLAMLLTGVYLLCSAVFRVIIPDQNVSTWVTVAAGLILGLVFVFMSQERQLES
jgi:hypothetical protein